MNHGLETEIAQHVWDGRYRLREGDGVVDVTLADTQRRVARALASVEVDHESWEHRFLQAMDGFTFIPGGRILAGAGSRRAVTLFNCFVMGIIPDEMSGIFEALQEGATTMQKGGGIGYDFSTLRPKGTPSRRVGTIASGPVSFMRLWDAMCATVLSTGARRGAMMATLRCDHPDIETFVNAKQDPRELRHFNLSVQVSDHFLRAVQEDAAWHLVFPATEPSREHAVQRRWTGSDGPVACEVHRRIRARALWDRILSATYSYAEPGVLFVDRLNAWNNLWYREDLTATNPCGEIPLQPYGACDLGSINLAAFVRDPFGRDAHLDVEAIEALVPVAVRMLDNVVDVSSYPLPAQREQALGTRRIGLGITGLADALAMLRLPYDSEAGRNLAEGVMRRITNAAYRTSVALAREKGPFPFFERDPYLQGRFLEGLPPDIRDGIANNGIRNSHLLAIAPTGTISLLANNVSSGVEPIFDYAFYRNVLTPAGVRHTFPVQDAAYRSWRRLHGDAPLPAAFMRASDIAPQDHLLMAAALQPHVDNAISKTIHIPEDYDFDAFKGIYDMAYDYGLKGCTTYRPNPVTGAVLEHGVEEDCCPMEPPPGY